MTDVVVNIQTGSNSHGPFPDVLGNGSGWYDGVLNGDQSCGTITEDPPMLGSVLLNMVGTSTVDTDNTFCVLVTGAQPQSLFLTCEYTDGGGTPRSWASADAASYSTTDYPGYTIWRWEPTESPENPGAGASPVPVTFTNVDTTMPPSIVLDEPTADGSLVTLTWTPAVGTGGDEGEFTSFSVYRNDVALATGLDPTLTTYIDSGVILGDSLTYEIQGDYTVAELSPVVSNDETICADVFNCDCEATSPYATLAEVRRKMLIRLGYPNQMTNPPPGMATLMDQFLRDAQDEIYIQLQRAALRTERFFRWTMTPGQRYYGLDANDNCCDAKLEPLKITWVGFEDLNGAWYRLNDGIPPEYYTRANINFGWPTRYEVRSCIEIFPAPQAAYTLWIKGDFGLAALVEDDDRFTIDDKMVFLLALGNAKAHYGQKDAQLVLTQAGNYTKALVAGTHGTRRYVPRAAAQNPLTPPRFLPLGSEQA